MGNYPVVASLLAENESREANGCVLGGVFKSEIDKQLSRMHDCYLVYM
jgi:hypothetical protein